METSDKHLEKLDDIIQLMVQGKISGENEAIQKFDLYLGTVGGLGTYDPSSWTIEWRNQIEKFGKIFKTQNPGQFLNIINDKLKSAATSNKEVLEYIKSRMNFYFLPNAECKTALEHLVLEYPFNPEFRNSLGNCFAIEENFLAALNEYKLALKFEPGNKSFRETRTDMEQQYLSKLIADGEYDAGERYIQNLLADDDFINSGENRKITVDLARRIKDHQLVQKKIKDLEVEFKTKMNAELDHERRRLIEIFGFFAAIIAFLLSTVSIGENFSFIEALYFIIALGIILILFVTTIYIMFSSERIKLLRNKVFWILIAGLFLMFLLIVEANPISKIIDQLLK